MSDVIINGKTFDVPFSLSQISLRQCIEYYEKFGQKLEMERQKIDSMAQSFTPGELALVLENYIDKTALAWYNYWTGFDFFEIQDEKLIEPVKKQFRILQELLHNEDDIIESLGKEVHWKGETWRVSDIKDCSFDEMNFMQIQLYKSVFYHIEDVRKNKWDAMIYLCALFFRKKDEQVESLLTYPDFTDNYVRSLRSPILDPARVELMKELPMNYVMSIKMLISVFFENEVEKIFHGSFNQPLQSLSEALINHHALTTVKSVTDRWENDFQSGKISKVEYDSKIENLFKKSNKSIRAKKLLKFKN